MMARRAAMLLAPLLVGAALGALIRVADAGSGRAETSLRFRNVAAELGVVTRHRAVPGCGANAAGAAWGDVEGDGDLDFFLPQQERRSELWVQGRDGSFRERGRTAGIVGPPLATSAAFADYDDDGDQDIYVGSLAANQLYENDGGGTFQEVPFSATADPGPAMSVSWIDFDRDGHLDLFVANGNNCFEDPPAAPNRLYRQRPDGSFSDRSRLLPAGPSGGVTLDAVWLDSDGDGDDDLYLANDDLNGRPNALLANEDGRAFGDRSDGTDTRLSRSSMGAAAGDVDGDATLDLAVTDIGREALLVADGNSSYTEVSEDAGFGREKVASGESSITWGLAFADFDNDADLDAFAAGGALGLERARHDDALYENSGGGRFVRFDVPAPGSGRSVAPADWDRDGDVDLLVGQINARPLLLRNRGRPRGHWVQLVLRGTSSAAEACGAVVRAFADDREQLRQIECRSNERTVHFGIGAATEVERVTVSWPSGARQTLGPLRANRRYLLTESRDPVAVQRGGSL